MTAAEMAKISNQNGFESRLAELIAKQDASIKMAAERGYREAIFQVHDSVDDYMEPYIRKHYEEHGFWFMPVGVIGGVCQRSMRICW